MSVGVGNYLLCERGRPTDGMQEEYGNTEGTIVDLRQLMWWGLSQIVKGAGEDEAVRIPDIRMVFRNCSLGLDGVDVGFVTIDVPVLSAALVSEHRNGAKRKKKRSEPSHSKPSCAKLLRISLSKRRLSKTKPIGSSRVLFFREASETAGLCLASGRLLHSRSGKAGRRRG